MLKSLAPQQKYQTKEEFVYNVLRKAILNGDLKAGERLIMDHLGEDFNVSPIPIRGAMKRLQSEGLVDFTPYSGAVVSSISQDMLEGIFLILEALESIAFRLAAKRVKPEDLSEARHILSQMEKALLDRDPDQWADAYDSFHRSIAELTSLKLLVDLTGRTLDHWARLRQTCFRSTLKARMVTAQAEHHRLVEMLARGEVEKLDALVSDHNRRAYQDYYDHLQFHNGSEEIEE